MGRIDEFYDKVDQHKDTVRIQICNLKVADHADNAKNQGEKNIL